MCEEWRPVVGFEDWYEVSDHGRVRRKTRTVQQIDGRTYPVRERVLNAHKHPGGYRQVCLRTKIGVNGRMKYLHRIVAQAFLPNPENLPEVNHKNLDKTDNRKENLEWCHGKRNMQHATKQGKFHGRTNPNKRLKLTPEQADEIKSMSGSSEEVGERFGVSGSLVLAIRKGRRWEHPDNVQYEFA